MDTLDALEKLTVDEKNRVKMKTEMMKEKGYDHNLLNILHVPFLRPLADSRCQDQINHNSC